MTHILILLTVSTNNCVGVCYDQVKLFSTKSFFDLILPLYRQLMYKSSLLHVCMEQSIVWYTFIALILLTACCIISVHDNLCERYYLYNIELKKI